MIARLRSAARAAFHMERRMFVRLVLAWLILPAAMSAADEPLRDVINRELAPPSGTSWPKSDDAEFLRRVSIDLNGMPPTTEAARAFLADTDPAKREKVVDQLMASPLYARHIATTLDVMLMERRPATHVTQDEWSAWLLKSVRDNKPWNVMARELMTADGDTPENRAASRFYLDRNAEPHVITRDIGRVFFGRDMQCNQCHDSPLVADFLQRDYHGLLAIASTGYAVTKKVAEKDVTVLAERAPTDLTFESVFDKGNSHRTAARLPGSPSLTEPFFYPGDDYTVAPADGVRAQPRYSRRAAFAELATNGSNRSFNENIANRLWAMMLGRGLVHPLDMMHPDNPAASPSLLKALGDRLVATNFDMKMFLREVALSDVYQRPFDLTNAATDQLVGAKTEQQQIAAQKESLEVLARDAASTSSDADGTFSTAESAMLPVAAEADIVRTQYTDAKKKVDEAAKATADATAAFTARKSFADTLQQAAMPLNSASMLLPGDAQLAMTAQQLTARAAAAAAELPALEKTVAEKTAAVTPVAEALAVSKGTLDAAMQKLQPLLETVRAEEVKVVAARAAMQDALLKAASVKSRLAALDRITEAGDQKTTVAVAAQTVVSQETAVAAATKQVAEYMPVVAERTTKMQDAEKVMTAATTALNTAQEQVSQQRAALSTLNEAVAALNKAIEALPGDESMASGMATLVAKTTAVDKAMKSSEKALVAASQMSAAAADAMKAAQSAMVEANAELDRRQKMATQSGTDLAGAKDAMTVAASAYEKAMETIPADLSAGFALSQLKPLSPEQMLWSIYRVTGVYDRYVVGEFAELDKAAPLTDEQKADAAGMAARAVDVEQKVYDKLKGNITSFVQIYGGAPGQPQNDFYASPDQALFTANGGSINSWISPAAANSTERVANATDPKLAAEELYLGVLSRLPVEQELEEVTAFLAARPDRSKAAQELVWGLISSAEFRFNK